MSPLIVSVPLSAYRLALLLNSTFALIVPKPRSPVSVSAARTPGPLMTPPAIVLRLVDAVAAAQPQRLAGRVDVDDAGGADVQPGVDPAVAGLVDRAVHRDVGTGQVRVDDGLAVVSDDAGRVDRPRIRLGDDAPSAGKCH